MIMYRSLAGVFFLLASYVMSQPIDRQLQAVVDHDWFEVGVDNIDDRTWTTITTLSTAWERTAAVFISLPDIGGELYTEGIFLAPKLKNIMRNGDNTVSFDVKLVQANDSFCSKQWYVPAYLPSKVRIFWTVMEHGVYTLNNSMLIVSDGNITRNNSDSIATVQNENAVRLFYPTNCDGDTTGATCVHP
jgi:hypothetical protein